MTKPSVLLNEFLTVLGSNRMAIDSQKKQLVDLPAYTSTAAISLVDIENKGHATLADLYEFLKKKYIYPTEKELFTLFKEIDSLKIGVIEPNQLAQFVTPQTRLGFTSKSHFFDLESALAAVFQQYLDNSKAIQNLKEQFRTQCDYRTLFKLLDTNRNGKVSTLEVRSFMLSHGCHDQDIISNTTLEIHNRLGSNFTEVGFSTLIGDGVATPDSSSLHQSITGLNTGFNSSIYGKLHKTVESTPTSVRKVTEFDEILEVRNQQNEERRHYLKEQERLRNKLMDDVLARKRSYLNIRTKEDVVGERIHRRWDTEEDHCQHLQQKQKNFEPERTSSALRLKESNDSFGRTTVSPSFVDRKLFKSSYNKEEVIKRAASEAQLKIQQIELNARAKAQQRRRLEIFNHEPSSNGYQQLLLKKNSQFEIQKQKRQTLERELSRSRDEIQLLKSHLQSIDKLNYQELDFPRQKNYKNESMGGFYQTADNRRQKGSDILSEVNRQVGTIYQPNRTNLIRGQSSVFSKDSGDSKYQLEQALRRSRVERQFAKFKLEKELARSRIPWR